MDRALFKVMTVALIIAVNKTPIISAVDALIQNVTSIPAANFDECIRLRNPNFANCTIPDAGFSLDLPKSSVLRNVRIGFLGDSVLKQIFDAFECMYPETKSNYFVSGVTGHTLCDFLVNNSDSLESYNFDILILSEGLWFNLHPFVKKKMVWRDYLTDIPCALMQLRKMDVNFLWLQRTFQHFNTRGGNYPHFRVAKTKRQIEKYAECVPLSSFREQSAYHKVLNRNFRMLFPKNTGFQMVLADFTAKMHLMHTRNQKDGMADCTHFCQKKTGVPFQFAKKIAEQVTRMDVMLNRASAFNQDIGGWDTSQDTNM